MQAELAHGANISDVALLKRLRNSKEWLRRLCVGLLRETEAPSAADRSRRRLRVIDGTVVKEPGKTGSQWRILYSLQLPGLGCDFLDIRSTEGKGTSESFRRVPMAERFGAWGCWLLLCFWDRVRSQP